MSLVGRWLFTESGASNRIDISGAGHDLTTNTGTPIKTAGHAGAANAADTVTNKNQIMSTPDHADFRVTGDFSIAGFMYINSGVTATRGVVAKWSGATPEYALFSTGTNLYWRVNTIAGYVDAIIALGANAGQVSYNIWHPYCIDVDIAAGINNLYVDDPVTPIASVSGVQTPIVSTGEFVVAGLTPTGAFQLNGSVDDISAYNHKLSQTERSNYFSAADDLANLFLISGVVTDRKGNPINCSAYPVTVHVFDIASDAAPLDTVLCTDPGGLWGSAAGGITVGNKYLVQYEMMNPYNPTGDYGISGASVKVA